jgi:membrane-bound lytic murein transglycosylase A
MTSDTPCQGKYLCRQKHPGPGKYRSRPLEPQRPCGRATRAGWRNFFQPGVVVLGTILFFLSGCGIFEEKIPPEVHEPSLKKLAVNAYPRFSDSMGFSGFNQALAQSLAYYRKLPDTRMFAFGPDQYPASLLIRSLETLQAFLETGPGESSLNRFIRDRFHVYASVANEPKQVLFTGYFEPTFFGSLYPDDRFVWPLYPVPEDLLEIDLARFSDRYAGHDRLKGRVEGNRVVPYFSRQAINTMTDFHLRAQPVAWLESRVDRFFLEIQGSGRIQTPENEIIRIQYAGANGNPYRSIGRYLIDNQEIPKEHMSMQAIRQWLEANPHRMDEVLHHNESFVFFQTGTGGPFGNIGVTLTPLRSMATDYRLFPRGALCFVQTRLPDPARFAQADLSDAGQAEIAAKPERPGLVQDEAPAGSGPGAVDSQQPAGAGSGPVNPEQWDPVSLFVMNQDTGGAIRGPARADLFCGSDAYARFTAGHMNVRGKIFFLVIK